MNRFHAAAACVVLLIAAARPAVAEPPGFAFLEIPAGARAAGMGGAFSTLAQGVEAAFWNPAGLEGVKGVEMTGSHAEYVQKLRHDQFGLAARRFGGGLALTLRALYSEPIDERDELGNLIGSFGAHDLEFALGYGHAVGGGLSVGATAQLVRERIADASATTYAFGAGCVWAPPRLPGVRLGVSAHNLGPSTQFDVDGAPGQPVALPAAVQAGGSWQLALPRGAALRAALEGRFTRGRSGIGMAGVELATPGGPSGSAMLRAGYRMNDDATAFSVGAGYAFQALRLDYAFVPLRLDLGDTHRVALTARF